MVKLSRLIESNLSELVEARKGLAVSHPLLRYLDVLSAYLRGDIEGLTRLVGKEPAVLEQMNPEEVSARLRLQIRTRSVEQAVLARAIALAKDPKEELIWRGELSFVIAMALETSGDDCRAQEFYKLASEVLELGGCPRKSIKAFANYVAAETRIHPDKKLIVEYEYIFRKAKRLKEFGVAGMALNNISREYQLVGALNVALKFANRALVYLGRDFGSLHYYLGIVHRAHVLFDLHRDREAVLDLEQASACDFPEIKEAIKTVKKNYLKDALKADLEIKQARMTVTWRERFNNGPTLATLCQLGEMEEALVRFLATGAHDKFQIIEHLYGKKIEFESAENRFKNLIGRIRKKYPGLLAFENGKYRVSDDSFLPTDLLKAG